MSREAEIHINVKLDEQNFPEEISWSADDVSGSQQKAEAMLLSMWDKKERNTLAIDLWTREMVVEDMNILYFQIFQKMADTYYKATNNADAANIIKEFSLEFGKKLDLIKNNDSSQG